MADNGSQIQANPSKHSNPHDKPIAHDPHTGTPDFQKFPDINYRQKDYPEGPPEFKSYRKDVDNMDVQFFPYSPETWRFKTISEFKNSVNHGAEINFNWKGREYHTCPIWPENQIKFCICPLDIFQDAIYENAEDMLSYMVGVDRLHDIITQIQVTDRTL